MIRSNIILPHTCLRDIISTKFSLLSSICGYKNDILLSLSCYILQVFTFILKFHQETRTPFYVIFSYVRCRWRNLLEYTPWKHRKRALSWVAKDIIYFQIIGLNMFKYSTRAFPSQTLGVVFVSLFLPLTHSYTIYNLAWMQTLNNQWYVIISRSLETNCERIRSLLGAM